MPAGPLPRRRSRRLPARRGRRARALVLALAAGLAAGPAAGPAPGQGREGGPAGVAGAMPAVGSEAPDFRLAALRGPRIELASLRGKVVLLDFWATWCAPCHAAVPHLKALAREMAGEPFVLVGISEEANARKVEEFASSHGMDWPQAWDDLQRVTRALYKVRSFPTYVLIGPDGKILHVQSGWSGRARRQLQSRVREAVRAARTAGGPAPAPAPG